jgi:hypothetical protein
MRFRVEIRYGERIPRGYGLAWRDYARDLVVCLPLGLNVLAAWGIAALRWLRFPPAFYGWDRQIGETFARGWREGHEAGIRDFPYECPTGNREVPS